MIRDAGRKPDFHNLELVLQKKVPPRPVMFDFIIGDRIERLLTGPDYRVRTEEERLMTRIRAFDSAGYDHAPVIVRGLTFQRKENHTGAATKSLNEGAVITDRESFDAYVWPELTACDFDIIRRVGRAMPDGMRLVPFSLDGVLENVIGIVGYENLCIMLFEDRELVRDIFDAVGSRLLGYFEACLEYDEVGAILQNDDWGFNTQTFLSPEDLREFVFPWHKRMAEAAHARGKYAILHSCGYYGHILEDIIGDMHMDGRHSYEDNIVPVETAYERLRGRLAVLGGMDVDFLASAGAEQVYKRAAQMVARGQAYGGYALGSGNSVPDYVPDANYLAMITAALKY